MAPAPGPPLVKDGVCKRHYENSGQSCENDIDCGRPILHVFGHYIVPSSAAKKAIYEVRVLASDCPQDQINNPDVAGSLIMHTSLWGDVCGEKVNGVDTVADGAPDITVDVMAVLLKFGGRGLSKTRADIIGPNPETDLPPDRRVDLTVDVMGALAAFGGRSFTYQDPLGPWPCPSGCAVKETAGMASRR